MNKRTFIDEESLFRIKRLISNFRPYSPDDDQRLWHDQIKSYLYMIGFLQGFVPIPEYPIKSPKVRGGIGKIDMVWIYEDTDNGKIPIFAFEIDTSIKQGSVDKLLNFDCAYKFEIGAGKLAGAEKILGSPRLKGTDIELIVIYPTENIIDYIETSRMAINVLVINNMKLVVKKSAYQKSLDEIW